MNMRPRGYIFEGCGDDRCIIASSLAEATSRLEENFQYDMYHVVDLYHIAVIGKKMDLILKSFWSKEVGEVELPDFKKIYHDHLVKIIDQ